MTMTYPVTRNPNDPGGDGFRSKLEKRVAEQLNRAGVQWVYEPETLTLTTVVGKPVRYLPDFQIVDADSDYELPPFIEVKPPDLLYQLRDNYEVPEHFPPDEPHHVTTTAFDMHRRGVDLELCKPKLLAENHECEVLICGDGWTGTRRLSIIATPDRLVFTKGHPWVNHTGHQQRLEAERRAAYWAREWERRQIEAEQARAEQHARRVRTLRWIQLHNTAVIAPRFDSRCRVCEANPTSVVYKAQLPDDPAPRWYPACVPCDREAQATP